MYRCSQSLEIQDVAAMLVEPTIEANEESFVIACSPTWQQYCNMQTYYCIAMCQIMITYGLMYMVQWDEISLLVIRNKHLNQISLYIYTSIKVTILLSVFFI